MHRGKKMRIDPTQIKGIYNYLPQGAVILQLGLYKDRLAIEKEVLEDTIERIVLYQYNDCYYITSLKEDKGLIEVRYNEKLVLEEVNYFKTVHLDRQSTYQILVGGKKESDSLKEELSILQPSEDTIKSIAEMPIYFDRVEIQHIQDTEQIIVWLSKELEAYTITFYRLQDGKIVEGGWDETIYFKKVVQYYKYLVEAYPKVMLYRTYLREAEQRIQGSEVLYKKGKRCKKCQQYKKI